MGKPDGTGTDDETVRETTAVCEARTSAGDATTVAASSGSVAGRSVPSRTDPGTATGGAVGEGSGTRIAQSPARVAKASRRPSVRVAPPSAIQASPAGSRLASVRGVPVEEPKRSGWERRSGAEGTTGAPEGPTSPTWTTPATDQPRGGSTGSPWGDREVSVTTVSGESAPAGAKSETLARGATPSPAAATAPPAVKSVPPSVGVAAAAGATGVRRASKSVSDGALPAVARTEARRQTSR